MQIQINTDGNIECHEQVAEQVEAVVRNALQRFTEKITRVEVHLSDENSDKKFGAEDERCLLEARPAGHQPIAVSHEAATTELAVEGALERLTHLLDGTLERMGKH
jgi:ribosome-associated translation inhibitor RaiA